MQKISEIAEKLASRAAAKAQAAEAAGAGAAKARPGAPAGNKNAAGSGRPSKYTAEIGEELLQKMAEGLSLRAAAAEMNIARATLYNWEAAGGAFAEVMDVARGKRIACLERRLLSDKNSARARSAALMIKHADPSYGDRVAVDHSGAVDHNLRGGFEIRFVEAGSGREAAKEIAAAQAQALPGAEGGEPAAAEGQND